MENNKIITKDYFESKVTIIIDKDKAVWFKGCDVAKILGYSNKEKAVRMHVDVEDKIKMKELMPAFLNQALISQPHTNYINESGLYSLIIRSYLKMQRNLNDGLQKKYYQVLEKLDFIQ